MKIAQECKRGQGTLKRYRVLSGNILIVGITGQRE